MTINTCGSSISYFFDDTERDEYKDANDYNTMTFIADGDVVKLQLSNIGKGFITSYSNVKKKKPMEQVKKFLTQYHANLWMNPFFFFD